MEYSLPEEVINQALGYLGKQPYEEVAAIIGAIKGSAKLVENATIKTETEKKVKQNGSNKAQSRQTSNR